VDRFEVGESMRSIARSIGWSQAGVHDLIQKTGGIRPLAPTVWSDARTSIGRTGGDLSCKKLRRVVEGKLERRWSPQQFVQGRGALREEFFRCLRQNPRCGRPS